MILLFISIRRCIIIWRCPYHLKLLFAKEKENEKKNKQKQKTLIRFEHFPWIKFNKHLSCLSPQYLYQYQSVQVLSIDLYLSIVVGRVGSGKGDLYNSSFNWQVSSIKNTRTCFWKGQLRNKTKTKQKTICKFRKAMIIHVLGVFFYLFEIPIVILKPFFIFDRLSIDLLNKGLNDRTRKKCGQIYL